VRIPSGECCYACWRPVAPAQSIMHSMTAMAPGLIHRSSEYDLKQILTWGSNSRCRGGIRQLPSCSMPVWSVLSVNSVNIYWILTSNLNVFCELTIVIPPLPCILSMVKAVSSIVELVNAVTSAYVNLFHSAMHAFASQCSPLELVPCSDGWRRTWWLTIHMNQGMPMSSIPQCK